MRSDALRTIFTADERFDDVRRMRIWARLAPRLPTASAAPRRWPWLVGASALAAAAVLVLVIHRPGEGALHVVPANGVLAMPLGPATRAALVGPGELLVVETGERTAVQLRGGTLYGEFTGAPGRSLRIEASGTVIEVVGTLFSVTATAKATCVSVAHGRVKFTSRGATTYVNGGQQACAGRATAPSPTHPLDTTTHDALARFDRTWFATSQPPAPAAPSAGPAPATPAAGPALATPAAGPALATPATGPALATSAAAPAPATSAAGPAASAAAPAASAAGPAPVPASPAPAAAPIPAPASPRRAAAPTLAGAAPVAAPAIAPARHVTAERPRVAEFPKRVAAEPRSEASQPATPEGAAASSPPATSAAKPEPPPTADALYRAADAALARGDAAAADRALADLLARDPDSSLADEALYERARLAFARGDWTATRGFVAQLATHGPSALLEPASYLGCRAAVNARADDAQQCFADYIAAFPTGAHVGDARTQLHRGTP